jgi:hypothetical protein
MITAGTPKGGRPFGMTTADTPKRLLGARRLA